MTSKYSNAFQTLVRRSVVIQYPLHFLKAALYATTFCETDTSRVKTGGLRLKSDRLRAKTGPLHFKIDSLHLKAGRVHHSHAIGNVGSHHVSEG